MAQEYHSLSLGNGIERKKEEREGNWRKRNLGWLKRINRVLFLLFANPLDHRTKPRFIGDSGRQSTVSCCGG